MFTQKEKERALYEARRKALMDERSRLSDAHRIGLEQGVKKAKREMVIGCLKQNMAKETIQELTGVSLQEIEKIHQQIMRS